MSRKFYGRMVQRPMTENDNTRRQTLLQKVWEVFFPYLLYYLAYNAAYLILLFVYQAVMQWVGAEGRQVMSAYAADAAGVMGGLGMLAGILPLVPMLGRELGGRGETLRFMAGTAGGRSESDEGTEERRQAEDAAPGMTKLVDTKPQRRAVTALLTGLLAFSVSLGLNALFELTGFAGSSQTYQEVADRQYGVVFAAGLVLYGLISPLAEEVVFRGVIHNRLRRLYNPAIGILASGLLFGAFHGNLVQGVYGACLGMLMAWLYERSGRFGTPLLFHAVANPTVYTTARLEGVQEILFTPAGCAALLVVSAGCVLAVHFGGREE